MTVRAAGLGSPRNGMPDFGGYRYRGAEPLALPARRPRKTPGPRPASVSGRILQALADLGGEASTTDIRKALDASGAPASARHVATALRRLAEMKPARVLAVGDARGGYRTAQRWRLYRPTSATAEAAR